MTDRTAKGASLALATQLLRVASADRGSPVLTWVVDTAPYTEEQWGGLLARLRNALHSATGHSRLPMHVKMRVVLDDGTPACVTVALPVPDATADLPVLCGNPPPVGEWRVELSLHEGPDRPQPYPTNLFMADIPF